jgi:hypothetical protein
MESGRDTKKLPFGDSPYGNICASDLGINIDNIQTGDRQTDRYQDNDNWEVK